MPSKTQHLDYDMLEELKEIMEDDFLELLRAFLSDSEMRIKGLKSAYAANDHDDARIIAHSFKGSSGNIGARGLSQLCKELEELAKGERTSDAGSLIDGLEAEFLCVSTELMDVVSAQG
jgi:HPt (histidine-containing phosphotransfer) domain-containing protein